MSASFGQGQEKASRRLYHAIRCHWPRATTPLPGRAYGYATAANTPRLYYEPYHASLSAIGAPAMLRMRTHNILPRHEYAAGHGQHCRREPSRLTAKVTPLPPLRHTLATLRFSVVIIVISLAEILLLRQIFDNARPAMIMRALSLLPLILLLILRH